MDFQKKTVLELFDSSQRRFEIPVYQRAYSWELPQWDVFLADLKEQIQGNNRYFYGNLLFETIKKGYRYEVIDGQQRITTLILFLRALSLIFRERKDSGETISIELEDVERIFFKDKGNIKLSPVEYDRAFFEAVVIENNHAFPVASPSQTRMKGALDHFLKELRTLATEVLLAIFEKVTDTEVTSIELDKKKEAALMFELQNNRGKDLTNMEKLKSYLMYQVYTFSDEDETDSNITFVSDVFKEIYRLANDIHSLNEDSILVYHCHVYVNGYSYRNLDDLKAVYLKVKVANRISWIKNFVQSLCQSFASLKKLESNPSPVLKDLTRLELPYFTYAFLIKGYNFFDGDQQKLEGLFRILEILVFRYKLIGTRADIRGRINSVLDDFIGDLDALRDNLRDKLNETWYWGDSHFNEMVTEPIYDDREITRYWLWQYESALQAKGYTLGNVTIVDEEIEHISPQTPPEGDPIETGYQINENGRYEDDFVARWINAIGNLVLISKSHNCSIQNIPFKDKLDSYIRTPLLKQQDELKTFITGSITAPVWDLAAIERRQGKLVTFAQGRWSFDSLVF